MSIPENLIVPLALALLGTGFGSYLTAVLKIYTVFPPILVNWVVGILIYTVLVKTGLMPFSIMTAAMYSCLNLGLNLSYWKNLAGLRDNINQWARKPWRKA